MLLMAVFACFSIISTHIRQIYRTLMPISESTLNSKWKNISVAFFVASFLIFESKNSILNATDGCFCLFFCYFDTITSYLSNFDAICGIYTQF